LPEAQIDRFMFKIHIDYPSMENEKEIINKVFNKQTITKVVKKEDIFNAQKLISQIYVDQKVIDYITHLVFATRKPALFNLDNLTNYIQHGASPRATLNLYRAAQAHAFVNKRQYVTPDDVKRVALPILRHRLILSFQAHGEEKTSDVIIHQILNNLATP